MLNWIAENPSLRGLLLVTFSAALLVGYVLSPMPVMHLCEATGLDEAYGYDEVFLYVWYPLELLYENVGAVEAFYDAYGTAYDFLIEAVTWDD